MKTPVMNIHGRDRDDHCFPSFLGLDIIGHSIRPSTFTRYYIDENRVGNCM